mmetsp:Transcript_76131/g.246548  ORF Transcript_76131/g.246548 Transcript_76131/m.246548 type:complete len:210 (+) Transcript_76131:292-921(+)
MTCFHRSWYCGSMATCTNSLFGLGSQSGSRARRNSRHGRPFSKRRLISKVRIRLPWASLRAWPCVWISRMWARGTLNLNMLRSASSKLSPAKGLISRSVTPPLMFWASRSAKICAALAAGVSFCSATCSATSVAVSPPSRCSCSSPSPARRTVLNFSISRSVASLNSGRLISRSSLRRSQKYSMSRNAGCRPSHSLNSSSSGSSRLWLS